MGCSETILRHCSFSETQGCEEGRGTFTPDLLDCLLHPVTVYLFDSYDNRREVY
jgi:hypothetical protein